LCLIGPFGTTSPRVTTGPWAASAGGRANFSWPWGVGVDIHGIPPVVGSLAVSVVAVVREAESGADNLGDASAARQFCRSLKMPCVIRVAKFTLFGVPLPPTTTP